MAVITKGRIYAPPANASKPLDRDVIYPETNIESVVTRTDGTTLKDDIGPKVVVSTSLPEKEKPSVTGREVLLISAATQEVSDIVIV